METLQHYFIRGKEVEPAQFNVASDDKRPHSATTQLGAVLKSTSGCKA